MSGFEPLSELPVAVIEGIRAFDHERRVLYGWLGSKVAEDVSVLSYYQESGELVHATAEVFAEASTAIADVYEDERKVACFLIARTWREDATDRLHLFRQQLPSDFDLELAELPEMEKMVEEILDDTLDLSGVYNNIGSNYFDTAYSDVRSFLAAHQRVRDEVFAKKAQRLFPDRVNTTYPEVPADSISLLSLHREMQVLKGVL